jgi:O-glycosyl hydrolase
MVKVSILPSDKYQTMEGFGVSGAWWSQIIGGWSDENRKKIIELLFHKDKGIGMAIYRYNIGAGNGKEIKDRWRRTESFKVEDGSYNWEKDKNALKVLDEINKIGVNRIVAFANSPVASMTKSGYVSGNIDGTSNLKDECYKEFSEYLINVCEYLTKERNIPIEWISPINEPHWDWKKIKGQEGCHYSTSECVKLIKILSKKIKESNSGLKIAAIEAGHWQGAEEYIKDIFDDEELKEELKEFHVHSYFSTTEDKEKATEFIKRNYPDIKLHMSEWTEMQDGRDYGMDSALKLANEIYEDLTIPQVVSWQYWIAVSKYNYRDGLIYTNEGTEDIEETKRLWVMGNYSKFVKKGDCRIRCESSSDEIMTLAFITDKGYKLVIINNADCNEEINLKFNEENKYKNLIIYETSNRNNLENIYHGEYCDKFVVPGKSVTTVIIN